MTPGVLYFLLLGDASGWDDVAQAYALPLVLRGWGWGGVGVGLPCAPPPKFRSPVFLPPGIYFSQEGLKRDLSPNDPNGLICNGRNLVIVTSGREGGFGHGPGGL